jgi:tetratricopeptide (TPR) repeat protein
MRLAGLLMLVGGVMTLVSPMMLILDMRIDTVLGIILVLVYILVCSFEIGAAKTVFRAEMGGWGAVMQALVFTLLARILMLFLSQGWYFYANAFLGVGELSILVVLYRRKDLFMPSEEEMEVTMRRMEGPTVRVASECPTCHEMVEMNWESCPYCGTKLTKHCGNCGEPLEEGMAICQNCGTPVESLETIDRTIESLRLSVEEVESQEAKASQYAKLAENLLKTGDNDGALDAYTEAIKATEFTRKRSYFMVKMANVLRNIGQESEALDILETAMKLDPQDYAGAGEMRDSILSPRNDEKGGTPQTS